jgi:hypothetical protein
MGNEVETQWILQNTLERWIKEKDKRKEEDQQ